MASIPRGVVALDRVVTLLAGLALVAGGAFVFAWHQGYLAKDPFRFTATQVSFPWMTSTVGASWWPWRGRRHRRRPRPPGARLAGPSPQGWPRLDADPSRSGAQAACRFDAGAAAAAAADEITAASDDVRSCRSKVVLDRGQIGRRPRARPRAGRRPLSAVTPVARASAEKLVRMVGRQDLT